MAPVDEHLIHRLSPDVEDLFTAGRIPQSLERLGLELVGDVDGKGGNEVLSEVLVLVVAPDKDKIGRECVDLLAHPAESFYQALTVSGGRGHGVRSVGAVLRLHLLGPVTLLSHVRRHTVAIHVLPQLRYHTLIWIEQRRVMSGADQQYLSHGSPVNATKGPA